MSNGMSLPHLQMKGVQRTPSLCVLVCLVMFATTVHAQISVKPWRR